MKCGMGLLLNFIKKMISKNNWMSSFYGVDWYQITDIVDLNKSHKGMIEWRINSNNYNNIEIAQKNDFFLVETQVKFKTTIKNFSKPPSFIRSFKESDKETLKDIVKE